MNPGLNIIILLLGVAALQAWSKPAQESAANSKAAAEGLAERADDMVPAADESILFDSMAHGSLLAKTEDEGGMRVCLRARVFRMLFRMLMLKASGFNMKELLVRSSSANNTDTTTPAMDDGLTQPELMDICDDLCALGTCPPGCPGNNNPVPPWGQGR